MFGRSRASRGMPYRLSDIQKIISRFVRHAMGRREIIYVVVRLGGRMSIQVDNVMPELGESLEHKGWGTWQRELGFLQGCLGNRSSVTAVQSVLVIIVKLLGPPL